MYVFWIYEEIGFFGNGFYCEVRRNKVLLGWVLCDVYICFRLVYIYVKKLGLKLNKFI